MCISKSHTIKKRHLLQGLLKGNQRRKLSRLLDMLYTPLELAEELGITRRQVYRVYVPLGCPYERDETGHVFINGHVFHNWYRTTYKKLKLSEDEAYCLACKGAVRLIKPVEKQKGNYHFVSATCPICGKKLSKAISNRRKND